MIVDEIEKEPYDEFGYAVRYNKVLAPGERITANTLSAIRASDSVDVTATFLASATGTVPNGTATGGSTTEIRANGTDLAAAGFKVGDWVVNHTQGWSAQIVDIKKTTTANDTLVIREQAIAAANLDVFSAAKVIASIRAGSDGNRIKVVFKATTNLSRKFEDEVLVRVKDN